MKKFNKSDILRFGPCKDISNIFPKEFSWDVFELMEKPNTEVEDIFWICFRTQVIGEELLSDYVIKVFSEKFSDDEDVISALKKYKEDKEGISKHEIHGSWKREITEWDPAFLLLEYWISPEVFYNPKPIDPPIPVSPAIIEKRPKLKIQLEDFKQFIIKNQDRLP